MPTATPSIATKKIAPATKAVRALPPHRELTQAQEEVVDLCCQLILHGGRRQEVIPFLTTLYRHQYLNRSFVGGEWRTSEQWAAEAKDWAGVRAEEAFQSLVRQWPEPKKGSAEEATDKRPSPGTIKKIVQTDLRSRLSTQFKEFLSDTEGIEAIWCLNEILEFYNAESEDLIEAVSDVVDNHDCYIRVHMKDAKKVKEFAELVSSDRA